MSGDEREPRSGEAAPEARGHDPRREARLDQLREEAARTGRVEGAGVRAAGGPLPAVPVPAEDPRKPDAARSGPWGSGTARAATARPDTVLPGTPGPGYWGRPILKPPVWTWEVPAYFFVGGTAGMAAVLALAVLVAGAGPGPLRAALWTAAAGALLSPLLLILDLGRPRRFLAMLRVFKWRSPMSMGAWILAAFGAAAVPAAVLATWVPGARTLLAAAVVGAALLGAVLAVYTGVLLGATAIPVWAHHHRLLPLHFGASALGSAAAVLELAGFPLAPLNAIGLAMAAVETVVGVALELRRLGAADRALHRGRSGWLLRAGGTASGPLALLLRIGGWIPWAAAAFLLGALVTRYGWVDAGRASARDPEAAEIS